MANLMTLDEFRASRVESADCLGDCGQDDGEPARPGYVYADGACYIEREPDGSFWLLLHNQQFVGRPLEELEAILWRDFYVPEFAAAEEKLVHPALVFSYNWPDGDPRHGEVGRLVQNELFDRAKVGTVECAHAGAPGSGRVLTMITRIDGSGAYGVEVENTIRELSPEEVR